MCYNDTNTSTIMKAITHITAILAAIILAGNLTRINATEDVEPLTLLPLEKTELKLKSPALPAVREIAEEIPMSKNFKPAVTLNIYDLPYSPTLSVPNWGRLWGNTAVLMAGGITTMVILEALPEESTAWNRAENSKTPLFKRWLRHVKEGPVWDGDKFIFNYVLHPYAGAAYYMSARSCGFNCWGSFLYSFCISTFFWEYGFEAFNEIPSVQDLVITPVVGSLMGEGFYLIKRHIVDNGYRLLGSPVLGYAVAWLCDPVNETIGYFRGYQRSAKRYMKSRRAGEGFSGHTWMMPGKRGMEAGFSICYNF